MLHCLFTGLLTGTVVCFVLLGLQSSAVRKEKRRETSSRRSGLARTTTAKVHGRSKSRGATEEWYRILRASSSSLAQPVPSLHSASSSCLTVVGLRSLPRATAAFVSPHNKHLFFGCSCPCSKTQPHNTHTHGNKRLTECSVEK